MNQSAIFVYLLPLKSIMMIIMIMIMTMIIVVLAMCYYLEALLTNLTILWFRKT